MDEAVRLFRSTREFLTPVLNESAFLDKGMVTPEEFVRAGDHLARSSPSWKWESGDPTKIRPYLPNDKQYLIIRGVPSYERVSVLENNQYFQADENDGTETSDWWSPSHEVHNSSTATSAPMDTEGVSATEEYLDLEDENLMLDDSAAIPASSSVQSKDTKLRRYDVSITYDNYYRTPRIWLYGYDETGTALDPSAMFEVSVYVPCK